VKAGWESNAGLMGGRGDEVAGEGASRTRGSGGDKTAMSGTGAGGASKSSSVEVWPGLTWKLAGWVNQARPRASQPTCSRMEITQAIPPS
jgi:hypothetical protein